MRSGDIRLFASRTRLMSAQLIVKWLTSTVLIADGTENEPGRSPGRFIVDQSFSLEQQHLPTLAYRDFRVLLRRYHCAIVIISRLSLVVAALQIPT